MEEAPPSTTPGATGEEAAERAAPPRATRVQLVAGTLLALVLVGVAFRLGLWQLHGWEARRTAEARDLTQLQPVPLTDLIGPDDPFPGQHVGQPVTVSGSWLPEGNLWVSDRDHDGTTGYWAVTPLQTESAPQSAILVVRGWSPQPEGAAPSGDAEVTGWLQPPEGANRVDDNPRDDVFPELRVADAVQRVDIDLFSGFVVADPERSDGLTADDTDALEAADLAALPKVGRFTAMRNFFYAIEWWVFGLFAAFIWWRWMRDQRAPRE